MILHGDNMRHMGDQWNKANAMIIEGNVKIKKGQNHMNRGLSIKSKYESEYEKLW